MIFPGRGDGEIFTEFPRAYRCRSRWWRIIPRVDINIDTTQRAHLHPATRGGLIRRCRAPYHHRWRRLPPHRQLLALLTAPVNAPRNLPTPARAMHHGLTTMYVNRARICVLNGRKSLSRVPILVRSNQTWRLIAPYQLFQQSTAAHQRYRLARRSSVAGAAIPASA